jgi:N-methylhydantoinase B
VAEDVRRGLTSAGVARTVYGLVLSGGRVDAAATDAARARIRAHRLAEAVPASAAAGSTPAGGGELLHPIADTVEAVVVGGERLIRCSVCDTRLGAHGEDYKLGTVMRERSFAELSPLNEAAPPVGLVAREFYCPGCGTAVALDIQPAGSPVLPECTFHADGEGETM